MQSTVERCPICERVRLCYVPEYQHGPGEYASKWGKSLPRGISVSEFESVVCDNLECIEKNAASGNQVTDYTEESVMTEKVVIIPRDKIRPFANQPRKFFGKADLKELADSIKAIGQLTPIWVRELEHENGLLQEYEYELIEGQRRWHACAMAGVATMKALVFSVKDEEAQFTMSVVANFGRVGHNPVETAFAIKRFKDWGKTTEQIAKIFAKSAAWVYQYQKLLCLSGDVLALMSMEIPEKKRLPFSTALLLADLPQVEQVEMAEKIGTGGLKHGKAKHMITERKKAMGLHKQTSGRSPNKDYEVLKNFHSRVRRELGVFLEMPERFFSTMFKSRDERDKKETLEELRQIISDSELLYKTIEKVGNP